jgi:hypothetical protein
MSFVIPSNYHWVLLGASFMAIEVLLIVRLKFRQSISRPDFPRACQT